MKQHFFDFLLNPVCVPFLIFGVSFIGRFITRRTYFATDPKRVIAECFSVGGFLCLDATMMMFASGILRLQAKDYMESSFLFPMAFLWIIIFIVLSLVEHDAYKLVHTQRPSFKDRKAWFGIWMPDIVGWLAIYISMRILLGR